MCSLVKLTNGIITVRFLIYLAQVIHRLWVVLRSDVWEYGEFFNWN
jgi:hypothetical protein